MHVKLEGGKMNVDTQKVHILQQLLQSKDHEISMLVKQHRQMAEETRKMQSLLTMVLRQVGSPFVILKDNCALTPNLEVAIKNTGENGIEMTLIEHPMPEAPPIITQEQANA